MLKKIKSDFYDYDLPTLELIQKTVFDERVILNAREGLTHIVWGIR